MQKQAISKLGIKAMSIVVINRIDKTSEKQFRRFKIKINISRD